MQDKFTIVCFFSFCDQPNSVLSQVPITRDQCAMMKFKSRWTPSWFQTLFILPPSLPLVFLCVYVWQSNSLGFPNLLATPPNQQWLLSPAFQNLMIWNLAMKLPVSKGHPPHWLGESYLWWLGLDKWIIIQILSLYPKWFYDLLYPIIITFGFKVHGNLG